MRPPGSAQALETRRMIAVRLLQQGKGVRETARLVGASSSSVVRWKQALQSGGEEALKAKPHPGRRPKLSQSQKEVLEQILLQGPQAAGFKSQLWTLERVAYVIYREFGVKYHLVMSGRFSRAWAGAARSPSEEPVRGMNNRLPTGGRDGPRSKKSPAGRHEHSLFGRKWLHAPAFSQSQLGA